MTHTAPDSYILNTYTSGGGKTVVLIHGVAGSHVIWQKIIPGIQDSCKIVASDLLGYGHSPKPRLTYTTQVHIEAIHATLEKLNLEKPYILVGLSMGSSLAVEYAARWPEDVASIIGIGLPYYRNREEAVERLSGSFWVRVVLKWGVWGRLYMRFSWIVGTYSSFLLNRFKPKIYSLAVAQESLLSPYRVLRSSLIHGMLDYDVRPSLRKVTVPITLIHGIDDDWSDPDLVESLVAGRPRTKFIRIEDAGHNVAVLKPEPVIEEIKRAVAEVSHYPN